MKTFFFYNKIVILSFLTEFDFIYNSVCCYIVIKSYIKCYKTLVLFFFSTVTICCNILIYAS